MMATLDHFLWGATAMGCWTAGFFFLRFWSRGRDRLFFIFALAFWMLALNWTVLAVVTGTAEVRSPAYVIRLIAFLLLIVGFVDKNRRSG